MAEFQLNPLGASHSEKKVADARRSSMFVGPPITTETYATEAELATWPAPSWRRRLLADVIFVASSVPWWHAGAEVSIATDKRLVPGVCCRRAARSGGSLGSFLRMLSCSDASLPLIPDSQRHASGGIARPRFTVGALRVAGAVVTFAVRLAVAGIISVPWLRGITLNPQLLIPPLIFTLMSTLLPLAILHTLSKHVPRLTGRGAPSAPLAMMLADTVPSSIVFIIAAAVLAIASAMAFLTDPSYAPVLFAYFLVILPPVVAAVIILIGAANVLRGRADDLFERAFPSSLEHRGRVDVTAPTRCLLPAWEMRVEYLRIQSAAEQVSKVWLPAVALLGVATITMLLGVITVVYMIAFGRHIKKEDGSTEPLGPDDIVGAIGAGSTLLVCMGFVVAKMFALHNQGSTRLRRALARDIQLPVNEAFALRQLVVEVPVALRLGVYVTDQLVSGALASSLVGLAPALLKILYPEA